MIETAELTEFARKNGWIVISQDEDHIRYLTPLGLIVLVKLYEDGSIQRIID